MLSEIFLQKGLDSQRLICPLGNCASAASPEFETQIGRLRTAQNTE
jgi:hypothetical protein